MAHRPLADLLEQLDESGALAHIPSAVDPALEIAELTERVAAAQGSALLIERPQGSRLPIVTNLLGTERRLCQALGIGGLEELTARVEALFGEETGGRWLDRLFSPDSRGAWQKARPKQVKAAACQQVVHLGRDVDLETLPALQCWPDETGRQLSGVLLLPGASADQPADATWGRVQLLHANRAAIVNDGQSRLAALNATGSRLDRIPVAFVVGSDPVLLAASMAADLCGLDALSLCGFLRSNPLELAKCRSCALPAPADAELVLEGYIAPDDEPATITIGGWGSQHYGAATSAAVMHVTAMTRRTNPILPIVAPHAGPGEVQVLAKAVERMILPLAKRACEELVDWSLPVWGGLQKYCIASMRKSVPLEARKVASTLWGLAATMHAKVLVIVDERVDVHDLRQVLAAIGQCVDFKRDVFFMEGARHPTDFAAAGAGCARMAIDATTKLAGERAGAWPAQLVRGSEIAERVTERWAEYGLEPISTDQAELDTAAR